MFVALLLGKPVDLEWVPKFWAKTVWPAYWNLQTIDFEAYCTEHLKMSPKWGGLDHVLYDSSELQNDTADAWRSCERSCFSFAHDLDVRKSNILKQDEEMMAWYINSKVIPSHVLILFNPAPPWPRSSLDGPFGSLMSRAMTWVRDDWRSRYMKTRSTSQNEASSKLWQWDNSAK